VVSLPGGREFWKPFPDPSLYEGKLPLLWRDPDVAVYAVPGAAALPPAKRKSGAEDWITRAASLLALVWLYWNSAINSSKAAEPGQSFS
jgi:hypothetical protein